jgi:hypothetical protein
MTMFKDLLNFPLKPRRSYATLKSRLPLWLISLLIIIGGLNFRFLFMAKNGVSTALFWSSFPSAILEAVGIGFGIMLVATLSIWGAGKIFKGKASLRNIVECLVLANLPELLVFFSWCLLIMLNGASAFDLDLPFSKLNIVSQFIYQISPLLILATVVWRLFLIVVVLSEGQKFSQTFASLSLVIAYFGMAVVMTLTNSIFGIVSF